MTSDDVLTLDEAAELLKVSPAVMRRAFAAGHIKAGKGASAIGWRVTRTSALAWVDAGMPGINEKESSDDETENRGK